MYYLMLHILIAALIMFHYSLTLNVSLFKRHTFQYCSIKYRTLYVELFIFSFLHNVFFIVALIKDKFLFPPLKELHYEPVPSSII